MTDVQQIVTTRGRHQIVILDGGARDAPDVSPDRYAVTTLGGAIIQRELTHDEAQAWLERLWTADGARSARSADDERPMATPARALRMPR